MKPELARTHFDLVLDQADRLRDQTLRDTPTDGRAGQNATNPGPSLPRAEAFEWPQRGTSEKADDYGRRAAECQAKAERADDDEARAFWLDLAVRWDQCADKIEEFTLGAALRGGDADPGGDFELGVLLRRARRLADEGHYPEMIQMILEADGFAKAADIVSRRVVSRELKDMADNARQRDLALEGASNIDQLAEQLSAVTPSAGVRGPG
jgi:hypothetical protein